MGGFFLGGGVGVTWFSGEQRGIIRLLQSIKGGLWKIDCQRVGIFRKLWSVLKLMSFFRILDGSQTFFFFIFFATTF